MTVWWISLTFVNTRIDVNATNALSTDAIEGLIVTYVKTNGMKKLYRAFIIYKLSMKHTT